MSPAYFTARHNQSVLYEEQADGLSMPEQEGSSWRERKKATLSIMGERKEPPTSSLPPTHFLPLTSSYSLQRASDIACHCAEGILHHINDDVKEHVREI